MVSNIAGGSAAFSAVIGPLYTAEEVGQMLKVSPRAVQHWVRVGVLGAGRYGRLLRIREADLLAFGTVLNQPPPLGE